MIASKINKDTIQEFYKKQYYTERSSIIFFRILTNYGGVERHLSAATWMVAFCLLLLSILYYFVPLDSWMFTLMSIIAGISFSLFVLILLVAYRFANIHGIYGKSKNIDFLIIYNAMNELDEYLNTKKEKHLVLFEKYFTSYITMSSLIWKSQRILRLLDVKKVKNYYSDSDAYRRFGLPFFDDKTINSLEIISLIPYMKDELIKSNKLENTSKVLNCLTKLEYVNLIEREAFDVKNKLIDDIQLLLKPNYAKLEEEVMKYSPYGSYSHNIKNRMKDYFKALSDIIQVGFTSTNLIVSLLTWYVVLQIIVMSIFVITLINLDVKVDSTLLTGMIGVPFGAAVTLSVVTFVNQRTKSD